MGQERGVDPWVEALGKARLRPIGAAERERKARHPADMMAAGAGAEMHRLGAVFGFDFGQLFGDLVQRLVPAYALPCPGASGAFAPHGVFEPVRVIDHFVGGVTNRAEAAMGERAVWIALDFDQHIVLDVHQDAATAVATAADAFENFRVLGGH